MQSSRSSAHPPRRPATPSSRATASRTTASRTSASRAARLVLSVAAVGVVIALLPGLVRIVRAQASDRSIDDQVARIVSRMERRDAGAIWSDVRRLRELGDPAVPVLRARLETSPSPIARLGCASALLDLGDATRAVDELLSLMWNAPERSIRIQAVRVLSRVTEGDLREKVAAQFDERLADTYAPSEKIALAQGLWKTSADRRIQAKDLLRDVLRSDDPDTRLDAALALADIGEHASARAVLDEFRDDPTLRGDLARAYSTILRKNDQIERQALGRTRSLRRVPRGEGDVPDRDRLVAAIERRLAEDDAIPELTEQTLRNLRDYELLEEVVEKILSNFMGSEGLDRSELIDAAARGVLEALDPHSTFFTGDELERWSFDLDPNYAGIGAYVNDDEGKFTITRPIYSGPAYEIGLRSGDWILEVDGWSTFEQPVDEVTRRLKGLPGTSVKIKVARETWPKPREFEVVRDNIDIPTVQGEMLPGDIGYVRILTFGLESASELEDEMRRLASAGMRGLVLDLRNNSGGYLSTALRIVDKFLPAGKLIVECKSLDGEPVYDAGGKYQYFTSDDLRHEDVPVVVLVNRGSASASEIVAGSLQQHGRAEIVGTRSYGKGSVQNMFRLRSRPDEAHEDEPRENGTWDPGERYTDRNGNGRYDYGEPWDDVPRFNGRWDPGERFDDADGDGRRDEDETYTDANRNGRFDPPERFVDSDGDGKWDRGPHVKITIARYLLPNGVSIHKELDAEGRVVSEGGVVPDVEQELDPLPMWMLEEFERLREDERVVAWANDLLDERRQFAIDLARFDDFDASRYPGIETLGEELDTRLPLDALRRLLRSVVRREVQDEIGREFIQDLQEDEQIQRAVARLAETLDLDLARVPELRHIDRRFADARDGRTDGGSNPR